MALLTMIKKIMCGLEESIQKIAIITAKKMLPIFWKNPNVENDNYKISFDA